MYQSSRISLHPLLHLTSDKIIQRAPDYQVAGAAGWTSLPKDPFSIAASIILFPLMMDVVQMTIFRRPGMMMLAKTSST